MKKIISAIFLIIITLSLFTGCKKAYIDENFFSDWMQYLDGSVKIIDAVLPGSHDAGSKGLVFAMDTQDSTVEEQLKSGARYLDLRVKYNLQGVLSLFHGSQTGAAFDDVLNQISSFIENNPSEFLILDFQHFEGDYEYTIEQTQIDAEKAIAAELNPEKYALKKGVDLSSLTIGKIRESGAKYIITWGRTEQSVLLKDYIFKREDYLYSPYVTEEHHED
jgi:hypothetical protein